MHTAATIFDKYWFWVIVLAKATYWVCGATSKYKPNARSEIILNANNKYTKKPAVIRINNMNNIASIIANGIDIKITTHVFFNVESFYCVASAPKA